MKAPGDKFVVILKEGETHDYEFPKPPNGECIDCTVMQGAGKLWFYEDDRLVAEYQLSTAPGELFFVRLNTAPGGYKWKIHAVGTGTEGLNEFECMVTEGLIKAKKKRVRKKSSVQSPTHLPDLPSQS